MSIVSNVSVNSIYNIYHQMKFFGGYSITEIDEMNPNEREVFYSLLVESIKEKQKARENKNINAHANSVGLM